VAVAASPPGCAAAVDEARDRAAGMRSAGPVPAACHTAGDGVRIARRQVIVA